MAGVSGPGTPWRLHAVVPRSAANGPGVRYVVWSQGCALACPGCFNPETRPRTHPETHPEDRPETRPEDRPENPSPGARPVAGAGPVVRTVGEVADEVLAGAGERRLVLRRYT